MSKDCYMIFGHIQKVNKNIVFLSASPMERITTRQQGKYCSVQCKVILLMLGATAYRMSDQ